MNWVRVEERPPALGEMVLVTIHGSDIIQLQPGETLDEALERTRKEFRRVTIGMLDGEEEWTGADGWRPGEARRRTPGAGGSRRDKTGRGRRVHRGKDHGGLRDD